MNSISHDSTLSNRFPEVASQWSQRNQVSPNYVSPYSNKKFWWKCDLGHEWEAVVNNRTSKNRGCPYCSGHKVLPGFNDLATVYPELSQQWSANNQQNPSKVLAGSSTKYLWICDLGHEWASTISNRSNRKSKCPFCSGRRAIPGETDLATTHPEVANRWSTRNNISPTEVTQGSGRKVLLVCEDGGHEYLQQISVAKVSGCPYCSTPPRKILKGFNDLASQHPKLVAEWSSLNTIQPTNVSRASSKVVWWTCEKGHEWQASIANRSKDVPTGCPSCFKSGTSLIEAYLRSLIPGAFPNVTTVTDANGKKISVDIYQEDLNLVIEYDGAYWHKDRTEYDLNKTNKLLKLGYKVVRVRESSRGNFLNELDIIHPNLLQMKINYSRWEEEIHHVATNILRWVRG